MVRLGFGFSLHSKLRSHVRWCAVRQTTNVAEDGVTASGYGAENTREVRAFGYQLVISAKCKRSEHWKRL